MVQRLQIRRVQFVHLEALVSLVKKEGGCFPLTYPNEALEMNRWPVLRDPFL
jgi:hypothetical protein